MVTRAISFRPVLEGSFASRTGAALRPFAASLLALALLGVLLGGAFAIVSAQVTGERGIAPTASSSDIEVRGIEVDVTADSPEEARQKGWREAQRKAWTEAGGPKLSDGQLSGLVSSIVIQREQLGPRRYIATLGVIFDRQRASGYLGGRARGRASAPVLVIPVMASAGTYTSFEVRNPWQRAWAAFNPGTSRIDYVRPSGAGGDSLLLNFGQSGRRSRAWWRTTLDQYGAADVLVPAVRIEHQFPGGPVTAMFTARYGPDSTPLESFTLTAPDAGALARTLDQGVERMDGIFEQALADGKLRPDPTLRIGGSGVVDPALQRLINIGRTLRARDSAAAASVDPNAAAAAAIQAEAQAGAVQTGEAPAPSAAVSRFVVQFATPDAGAFDADLTGVRGTPGVRGLSVTSTAMGGSSVMSVRFAGSAQELAAALRSRGFAVNQSGNTLAISR